MAHPGNALPLRRGFTVVWSGWDPDDRWAAGGMTLDAPVAAGVSGQVCDEWVSGTRIGRFDQFRLSYPAAADAGRRSRLTVRRRQDDPPLTLPDRDWELVDRRTVRLLPPGTRPDPGSIYALVYPATDPPVQGVGFAATRDLVSWLRHHPGGRDLLGRRMSHTLGFGISQGGRYLRHFLSAGFNSDEDGRRVFDGMLAHSAGSGRLFFDVPFGQPFRTGTRHEDHDFPESWFPFSAARLSDPFTGASGSVLAGDGNDPKLIQTNTSSEYWQKGASLLHTDPLGRRDVAQPDHARVYLLAGTQHSGRAGLSTDRGPCAHPRNPHDPMPALRALLVALDDWVVEGRPAPPSRVPSIERGTLATADAFGFPAIPGVAVARELNGIRPPAGAAGAYRPLVPRVDADGNETDGVLLPDVAVPLGTSTGWNLYRAPLPEGELADRDGSFIPFAPTAGARAATGDPRPSRAERYPTADAYVALVAAACEALVADRLLLADDAAAYVARARTLSWAGRDSGPDCPA